ncbi:hypothetical protein BC828DRAFT_376107 [Blastocladiella britannica]|nr:hypothetical protein BC828DRAFT_376107 [Blastocladiella britannica]
MATLDIALILDRVLVHAVSDQSIIDLADALPFLLVATRNWLPWTRRAVIRTYTPSLATLAALGHNADLTNCERSYVLDQAEDILESAARAGHCGFAMRLLCGFELEPLSFPSLNIRLYAAVITGAVAAGNFALFEDVYKRAVERYGATAAPGALIQAAGQAALQFGQTEILQALCAEYAASMDPDAMVENLVHVHTTSEWWAWCLAHKHSTGDMLRIDMSDLIAIDAPLQTFQGWWDHCAADEHDRDLVSDARTFALATAKDRVDVLDWLWTKRPDDFNIVPLEHLRSVEAAEWWLAACRRGDLDLAQFTDPAIDICELESAAVLQWFWDRRDEFPANFSIGRDRLVELAGAGAVKILQWWWDFVNSGHATHRLQVGTEAIARASMGCHRSVLDWLWDRRTELALNFDLSETQLQHIFGYLIRERGGKMRPVLQWWMAKSRSLHPAPFPFLMSWLATEMDRASDLPLTTFVLVVQWADEFGSFSSSVRDVLLGSCQESDQRRRVFAMAARRHWLCEHYHPQ